MTTFLTDLSFFYFDKSFTPVGKLLTQTSSLQVRSVHCCQLTTSPAWPGWRWWTLSISEVPGKTSSGQRIPERFPSAEMTALKFRPSWCISRETSTTVSVNLQGCSRSASGDLDLLDGWGCLRSYSWIWNIHMWSVIIHFCMYCKILTRLNYWHVFLTWAVHLCWVRIFFFSNKK